MRRRKSEPIQPVDDSTAASDETIEGVGPWDSTQKSAGDDPTYVDLGSLIVKGRVGFGIQLPTDQDGSVGSVVLTTEDAALELRVFADARSGGLWDDVRVNLIEEVGKLNGEVDEAEGPYGAELHLRVPGKSAEGEDVFQPSRIVGIAGPRWMLRATFMGAAGLNPSDEGILMEALRDVIVHRGDEPRMVREPLPLTVPSNAIPEMREE